MKKVALLLDWSQTPEGADLKRLKEITLRKIQKYTDRVFICSKEDQASRVWFETAHEFLRWCEDLGSDTVVVILNLYAALFDTLSFEKMLSEHEKSLYDYTYPENLPPGILPELFTAEISRFILPTLPEAFPMFRRSVRELFESEISSYDTNLFVHPGRLMRYRVDLIPSSFFHYQTLLSMVDAFGEDPGIEALEEGLSLHPELVRTFPTYYEIELTSEAESGEFFAGALLQHSGEMKPELLSSLLEQIQALSYNPMVVFGLYGDPFLYSEFDFLVELIEKYPWMEFVFESRGMQVLTERAERLLKLPQVKLIFDLSFSDAEAFNRAKKPRNALLPFEGYQKIREKILSLPNRDKIYLQYTRSVANEGGILKFYEEWDAFRNRIIIKKPDCFGGRFTSFRTVDLSPIERFACLHLKHDLVIRLNGDVPLCRQDIEGNYLMGNVSSDGLKKCWKKAESFYLKQWKEKNWEDPPICKACDEWWIFNH